MNNWTRVNLPFTKVFPIFYHQSFFESFRPGQRGHIYVILHMFKTGIEAIQVFFMAGEGGLKLLMREQC
jgi:hypothetical protein